MNFYKTSNGLELLTDWAGDCHDYKTYNKNKQRAREAAGALLHSGNLIFEHGNIPRNSSEFVANMPYTSASDFAALWATCAYCAHQIKNRQTKLYLVGIALTDAQAVSVWRDCESNYIFEIVGEEPKAQPIILNTDKVYTLSGRFAIKAKDDAVYFVKIEE